MANEIFEFRQIAEIDFSYIYGEIIDKFRNITREDISNVIDIEYEHINSRIALQEHLMKTPKSLITKNKPVLHFNISLDTDYEGDVFSPLAFNTDLSHIIDTDDFTNSFIKVNNMDEIQKDMAVAFSFKRIQLTVEPNVINDYRPQLLNLYHFWKSKKYPGRKYQKPIYMSFPIPDRVYERYSEIFNLDSDNIVNVYKHIKTHSFLPIILKENQEKGRQQIFIQYETYLDYEPGPSNLTDGEKVGSVRKNFMLTRSFKLRLTIPSICYIKSHRKLPPAKKKETVREEINDSTDDWIPWEWSQYRSNQYKEVITTGYKFDKAEEIIDCKELLSDELNEFYQFILNDKNLLVSEYIKVRYFKNSEDNTDDTFIIKDRDLIIEERLADMKAIYHIGIYVKLEFYNEWLENHYRKEG